MNLQKISKEIMQRWEKASLDHAMYKRQAKESAEEMLRLDGELRFIARLEETAKKMEQEAAAAEPKSEQPLPAKPFEKPKLQEPLFGTIS